jgi:hypothetical protein
MMSQQPDSSYPAYAIKLQGHLSESWAEWFEGLAFTHEADGSTTLSGEVADQAALHGLLKKIRDLGLPLLAVNRVDLDHGQTSLNTDDQQEEIENQNSQINHS